MGAFLTILSLLIPTCLAFVFLPQTLHFLGEPIGYYLGRPSRARRALLLDRVAAEQRTYEIEHKEDKKEEDDWEQIERAMVGSAANGAKADQDWHGIVGFFHPFW